MGNVNATSVDGFAGVEYSGRRVVFAKVGLGEALGGVTIVNGMCWHAKEATGGDEG